MANVVKHLKFGSTTYDLPEGKNVLNLLCDTAPGADIGSFTLYVEVYDDQGTPNTSIQIGTYGSTTKNKITTASSWGQNTDFDMNIEAIVNGIPCILTKYSETSGGMVWNYRGSGHRFSFDSTSNNLYQFDFNLDLGINLTNGNYTGNLSGDFYSVSNVLPASGSGGGSSTPPSNWEVATVALAPAGQIQNVISTPQAGCEDYGCMSLGVCINENGQTSTYLHSLGHNFENSNNPGVKWSGLATMDYAGALQPNDNITLNLYFMTIPNGNIQKVIIPGIYDSISSMGGYLYFLDANQASITNVQYVGA